MIILFLLAICFFIETIFACAKEALSVIPSKYFTDINNGNRNNLTKDCSWEDEFFCLEKLENEIKTDIIQDYIKKFNTFDLDHPSKQKYF